MTTPLYELKSWQTLLWLLISILYWKKMGGLFAGSLGMGLQFDVLSGDCTQTSLYPPRFGTAPYTTDDCDKDDATQEGVVFANQVGGLNMHKGGNNVMFGDFHVELVPRFELGRLTYNPKKIQAWANVTPD